MQFTTFAFIMLALAFNAQASVTPLVLPEYPTLYSSQPGPIVYGGYPGAYSLAAAPLALPAPLVLGSEGTYVAKTPGSEHVAPLPGHRISATSINLEEAPGTKGEKTGVPTVAVHVSAAPYAVNIPLPTTPLLVRAPIYGFPYPREGTYVAKTPGSEHVAPLPGHLNSATSLNLEQAPGTEKAENGLPSVAVHSIAGAPYAAPLLLTAPLALPSGTHIQDASRLRVLLN